ncbi:hypothetical protein SAMN02799622_03545 [Methylobacterium sp. UNC378MF]|uniref:hypothetical protein n=1 Tax=Methylobacterium sp. UNC378MF TaxID=1502748 RepID=UPI00088A9775|nr:hypothetical protein [Methylobacterium sp. UNC378MF]SDA25065.1 hypothetical protein SAMN02799622_03545 [Methylobacterium sp. UNC378MF]
MIERATPIHAAEINSTLVRFFCGPATGPDMPWHAHEDLLAALALPRDLRRALKAALLKSWKEVCHTVEVDGEPVLIAPHFVAQGLIGMAQEIGKGVTTTPDIVDREYARAGVAAMNALTAHLPAAGDRFTWAMQAFHNQGGTE